MRAEVQIEKYRGKRDRELEISRDGDKNREMGQERVLSDYWLTNSGIQADSSGWQKPHCFGHYFLLPRVCIARKLELGAARLNPDTLWYGMCTDNFPIC